MANDDVNVVIYKILKYLYECKKAGKQPRHEDVMYNASLLRIPEAYWMDILLELNRKGLIRGINSIITKDGTIVTLTDEFGITLDGMQYVDENSMMAKASEYLGVTFVALLKLNDGTKMVHRSAEKESKNPDKQPEFSGFSGKTSHFMIQSLHFSLVAASLETRCIRLSRRAL